jgi:hypothetical protein
VHKGEDGGQSLWEVQVSLVATQIESQRKPGKQSRDERQDAPSAPVLSASRSARISAGVRTRLNSEM